VGALAIFLNVVIVEKICTRAFILICLTLALVEIESVSVPLTYSVEIESVLVYLAYSIFTGKWSTGIDYWSKDLPRTFHRSRAYIHCIPIACLPCTNPFPEISLTFLSCTEPSGMW
jgi:hypothetical protein